MTKIIFHCDVSTERRLYVTVNSEPADPQQLETLLKVLNYNEMICQAISVEFDKESTINEKG